MVRYCQFWSNHFFEKHFWPRIWFLTIKQPKLKCQTQNKFLQKLVAHPTAHAGDGPHWKRPGRLRLNLSSIYQGPFFVHSSIINCLLYQKAIKQVTLHSIKSVTWTEFIKSKLFLSCPEQRSWLFCLSYFCRSSLIVE